MVHHSVSAFIMRWRQTYQFEIGYYSMFGKTHYFENLIVSKIKKIKTAKKPARQSNQ